MNARRLFALVVVLLLAAPLAADSFTLANFGSANWSDSSKWLQNGLPATRTPGSLNGTTDTVALTQSFYTVTVDTTLVEAVTLSTTCPSNTSTCILDVPASGTLLVTGGSAIGSDAHLKLSGGTLQNSGTLNLNALSNLDWISGTLTGAGQTAVVSSANINASGTSMILTGSQIITLDGTLTYGTSASGFQINSGASIIIASGGVMDIQNVNGIGSDFLGNPNITVNAGGTFIKTAGNFGTNISPTLHNGGTVESDINTLVITGGSHSGVFIMNGAGTGIGFSGSPTFQNGVDIQGNGTASIGNLTIIGTTTATNLSMDGYGSITGGTLDVSGTFAWRGGSISGTTVNLLTGSTLTFTGESNAALTSLGSIVNGGTMNIASGVGSLSINSGASVINNNVLDLQGDVAINSNGVSSPSLTNAATMTKSAGASQATLNVPFNNSGAFTSTSGSLKLTSSGTHSGSFTLCSSCTVEFTGGTNTLDGASFSPSTAGTKFNGATISIGPGNVTVSTQLLQTSGTVTGAANLLLSNSFTWQGGTQSGSGQTVLGNFTHTFNGANNPMLLSGRTIVNNGTINYQPSGANYLSISSGAILQNALSFNVNGAYPINSDGVSTPKFDNLLSGALTKTSGAGTSTLACAVDNAGSVTVSSGTFAFNGGGTNSGALNVTPSSTAIAFQSGTYTFASGTSLNVNDLGTIDIAGATLTLSAPLTLHKVVLSNGTFTGSAATIDKSLVWSGGTILGPGTTTIAATASVDHSSPAASTTLDNRTLELNATYTYDGTSLALMLQNGATINVNSGGIFDSVGDGFVLDGAGTNAIDVFTGGTLRKTGGVSGTRFDVQLLVSGGTVSSQVNGQSLIVNGGGAMSSGTMTTTGSALLDFPNGSFTLSGGVISGSGQTRILGATVGVTANVNASTTLAVDGGTLDVAGSKTFQITTLNWTGGTLQGAGTKRVFGGTIGSSNPTTLAAGTLTLPAAAFTYAADAVKYLTISTGATLNIESGGTTTITNGGRIGGGGAITVYGTLLKNDAASSQIDPSLTAPFGTITIANGILDLHGGGSTGGTLSVASGATLQISNGAFSVGSGPGITGSGTVQIAGGTLDIGTASTIGNLLLDSGTLTGIAGVMVNGGSWSGGTMSGSGSTNIAGTATFTIDTATTKTLSRTLINSGTITYTGSALTFSGSGAITNSQTFDFTTSSGGIACSGCSGSFTNNGTVHKNGPFGASFINVPFDNGGLFDISSGVVQLTAGGTHGGSFTVGSGNALSLTGALHSFGASCAVSGAGDVVFGGTAATLSGTYGITGFTTIGGNCVVAFNTTSAATTGSLDIQSGELGGTAAFSIGSGASLWQGGTISGTSAFTIGAAATLAITNTPALDGRTITNNGAITLSGASIVNGTTSGAIVNNGTFTRSGSGNSTLDPAFTNSNFAELQSGTTTFAGGYTQLAGTTKLNGGDLSSPLTIDIDAGTLDGNGTITGNVVNAGTVAPGLSPGTITINGNYTQASSGTLAAQLAGTGSYDQLIVSGTATLDGTLDVTLLSFTPPAGAIFDVLQYATRSGAFATINLPSYTGGHLESSYLPTAVALTAFSDADLAVTKSGPASVRPGGDAVYTITITNNGPGAAGNVVVSDPTPLNVSFVSNSGDCTTAFPCTIAAIASGESKVITATYTADTEADGRTITNVVSVTSNANDTSSSNDTASATTFIECRNTAPVNLSPASVMNAPVSGTLSWSFSHGDSYKVYLGPAGSGCQTQFGISAVPSLAYSGLAPGTQYEWRVESVNGTCPVQTSACVTFTTATETSECPIPEAPLASVVGQTTSAKTYELTWEAVPGAVRYEVDEADNEAFNDATTTVTQDLSLKFKHDADEEPLAFYYRVRAFNECGADGGPYSPPVRVVIVPLPSQGQASPSVNVPAGSTEIIIQSVFIPGVEGQTLFFSAATDRPWLSVRPANGTLPPEGVTLEVVADPKTLPNGTFTASLIVTINDAHAAGVTANATYVSTVPISVNLVTPVTPVAIKPGPSQYSMIIPSVGHLDGIDSHWQSDVRITNAGFRSTRYRLTFTPSAGSSSGVKQTDITVDAGATTALDDIVRNWYGIGSLGDSANGMLEIVPLDDPATSFLSTVASSRTYDVTSNGTLGQFIPAIPFTSFIGKAAPNALPAILGLQQIAQSAAFRTNVGIAEASGNPASVVLSVFSGGGARLLDIPVQLAAGQQLQLNSVLANNGITLDDGRIEAQVVDGGGKVTAYASVVDNHTHDPLLVSGTPLSGLGATHYVLPGVANIDNPVAHWRTDMRVFNFGTVPQQATLMLLTQGGATRTASVLLEPGKVLTLDDVVRTQFATTNDGGAVHLTTEQPSSLVVTARTYNDSGAGTFGQFIPAVTAEQGARAGGRTLHILQVEDSTRYRTNVGLTEVSGKPVVVELQVVLPDSKITPTVQVPLAANEFRQFPLLRELGIGNVYNARIALRVISGEGAIAAYGSVIDETTQDPTYVPAQ